jgi:hypothetical protein
MVHILFDGAEVKLENFVQTGGGGANFFLKDFLQNISEVMDTLLVCPTNVGTEWAIFFGASGVS